MVAGTHSLQDNHVGNMLQKNGEMGILNPWYKVKFFEFGMTEPDVSSSDPTQLELQLY